MCLHTLSLTNFYSLQTYSFQASSSHTFISHLGSCHKYNVTISWSLQRLVSVDHSVSSQNDSWDLQGLRWNACGLLWHCWAVRSGRVQQHPGYAWCFGQHGHPEHPWWTISPFAVCRVCQGWGSARNSNGKHCDQQGDQWRCLWLEDWLLRLDATAVNPDCLTDTDFWQPWLGVGDDNMIEGSLEVKLPTIWTVEKQRWKESEEKRSEERRCRCAKRYRKVAIHCVFPMICGSGGSKSRLARAAGAEPSAEMRDEKLHAVVARSTFPSQNVQNTTGSDHFWKLRCRKSTRRCGAKHISNMLGPLFDDSIAIRCPKSARRCGEKHIWKSKVSKTEGSLQPLFDDSMAIRCQQLQRQLQLQPQQQQQQQQLLLQQQQLQLQQVQRQQQLQQLQLQQLQP